MKSSTSILLILLSLNITAQISVKWSNLIGGSSFESTNALIETIDNKLLIAGSSSSTDMELSANIGSFDIILIQANLKGEIEWIKNYGGTNSDRAYDIIESNEGGYLLVGGTESNDFQVTSNKGKSDVWIIKLNNFGDIQWELTVGDTLWDDSRKVIQDSDGHYLILSRSHKEQTSDDYLLTKVDQQGNLIWNKEYGGSEDEWPTAILETVDGYFIIGSSGSSDMDVSDNNGELDYWILKIDDSGNKIWDSNYGGLGSEVATSSVMTKDGNIIVTGRAYNVDPWDGNGDYWIIKVDPNGVLIWDKRYGGSEIDNPTQIIETNKEELLVVGFSSSNDGDLSVNNGNNDFWFLQLNQDGEIINSLSFGGSKSDRLTNVYAKDSRIYVTGYSSSNDFDITSNNGFSDMWFGEIGLTTSVNELTQKKLVKFYPNPISETLTVRIPENERVISFSLMTINGKLIKSTNSNELYFSQLKAGCYIAYVQTNKNNYQQKIIVNYGM